MNTQNIEVNIEVNNIEDMYKYAKLQFEAFNIVENRPHYNTVYQFSIDDPKDQMWFKQFIQMRFCEELAEAEEAREENEQHFMEELTDAFNFLLAATIMVGKDVKWVKEKWESRKQIEIPYWAENIDSIEDSLLVKLQFNAHWLCNLLKNRPWTQSHFPVSKKEFSERLNTLWETWCFYLRDFHKLEEKDIFDYFAKKYCVNMFRIRSGY